MTKITILTGPSDLQRDIDKLLKRVCSPSGWLVEHLTPIEYKRLYQGTFFPPEAEPTDPQDPDGTKRARRLDQWRQMRRRELDALAH